MNNIQLLHQMQYKILLISVNSYGKLVKFNRAISIMNIPDHLKEPILELINSNDASDQFYDAINSKNFEKVIQFISLGYDLNNEKNFRYNSSPVNIASMNFPSVVNLLLKAGAGKSLTQDEKDNVLQKLTDKSTEDKSYYSGIKSIIELGADVNSPTKYSDTPLHRLLLGNARVYNNPIYDFNSIEFLIKNGADVSIKDADGNTVFDWARIDNQPALIAFMENALLKENIKENHEFHLIQTF